MACSALGVPDVVCSGPAALVSDCCQPPAPMPAVDCQAYPLSCDRSGMCVLAFAYDDAVEIDLARDVPALKHRRSIWYSHRQPLPASTPRWRRPTLAACPCRPPASTSAPQGATSARAAGASFLADVPIDVGRRVTWISLRQAQDGLSAFLMDFNTPFVLILSGHVVVESGAVAQRR